MSAETPAVVIPGSVAAFLIACQVADVAHVAATYPIVCARCTQVRGHARVMHPVDGQLPEVLLPEGWRMRVGGVACPACARRR